MKLDEALEVGREANWDGYGALALTPDVIRNVKVFRELLQTGNVDATLNGTICFYTDDASLEIGKTRVSGYFKEDEKVVFFEGEFRQS
jgi:hypothetical protein